MKIINITMTEYKNFSRKHKYKTFGQSIEYSLLIENSDKEKIYYGLIDNNNVIYAAVCIIITNITSLIKEAYAPNGFLIDYENIKLLKKFIYKLKKELYKDKICYLITNPMFRVRILNNNGNIIKDNSYILNTFYDLEFIPTKYNNEFSKYDIVIENNISSKSIYNNFNRKTKRHIQDSIKNDIILFKGNQSNLEEFYEIVRKKTKYSLRYYQNILSTFNSNDNKMEIFFAKLDTNKFLINVKNKYENEKVRNEKINNKFSKNIGNNKEKLLNKKIDSDKRLEKYHQDMIYASSLVANGKNIITLGTCAILKNNKEIYFLIEGYNEEYRSIYSSQLLKWAIIKKYFSLGYHIFNLGEIHNNFYDKNNKYYNQYLYKKGFGGVIVEYPPTIKLVINKNTYVMYREIEKLKRKFKLIK